MCGRWSPDGGREVAWRGGSSVVVTAPAPGSLDFNEKGTWSSVEVGPVDPPDDVRAADELAAALRVTSLGPDDLSPQGRIRAEALAAAGHVVEGAYLLLGDGTRVHLGSGARAGGVPLSLGADELRAARDRLPLDLPAPLDRDIALAVLLHRTDG